MVDQRSVVVKPATLDVSFWDDATLCSATLVAPHESADGTREKSLCSAEIFCRADELTRVSPRDPEATPTQKIAVLLI
jgi:hypothetical protein